MATVTERMSVAAESLSLEAVRSLMQPQVAPCLSLYLPTHRNVPNNSVDLPTFRQLVGGLETGLAAAHPRHEIERLLGPFHQLAGDAFLRAAGRLQIHQVAGDSYLGPGHLGNVQKSAAQALNLPGFASNQAVVDLQQ